MALQARWRLVELLQAGDLEGVLRSAGRLGRNSGDPLLAEIMVTVKERLDQMEEDEEDNAEGNTDEAIFDALVRPNRQSWTGFDLSSDQAPFHSLAPS